MTDRPGTPGARCDREAAADPTGIATEAAGAAGAVEVPGGTRAGCAAADVAVTIGVIPGGASTELEDELAAAAGAENRVKSSIQ